MFRLSKAEIFAILIILGAVGIYEKRQIVLEAEEKIALGRRQAEQMVREEAERLRIAEVERQRREQEELLRRLDEERRLTPEERKFREEQRRIKEVRESRHKLFSDCVNEGRCNTEYIRSTLNIMTTDEIVGLLGQPQNVQHIGYDNYWYYNIGGNRYQLIFWNGRSTRAGEVNVY